MTPELKKAIKDGHLVPPFHVPTEDEGCDSNVVDSEGSPFWSCQEDEDAALFVAIANADVASDAVIAAAVGMDKVARVAVQHLMTEYESTGDQIEDECSKGVCSISRLVLISLGRAHARFRKALRTSGLPVQNTP